MRQRENYIKMKFLDVVQENSQTTTFGKNLIEDNLISPLEEILEEFDPELNVAELQTLASIILNKISSSFNDKILEMSKLTSETLTFNKMTDEEFNEYLKAKYGNMWLLCSLTDAELDRCPLPSNEERAEIMEKARVGAEAFARDQASKQIKISNLIIK